MQRGTESWSTEASRLDEIRLSPGKMICKKLKCKVKLPSHRKMKSEGSLITEKLKSQTPLILARLVFFGDQTPLTLFRVASKTSFYPPKLHFIDLPSMRQMKAETEKPLSPEFQANRSMFR